MSAVYPARESVNGYYVTRAHFPRDFPFEVKVAFNEKKKLPN